MFFDAIMRQITEYLYHKTSAIFGFLDLQKLLGQTLDLLRQVRVMG